MGSTFSLGKYLELESLLNQYTEGSKCYGMRAAAGKLINAKEAITVKQVERCHGQMVRGTWLWCIKLVKVHELESWFGHGKLSQSAQQ